MITMVQKNGELEHFSPFSGYFNFNLLFGFVVIPLFLDIKWCPKSGQFENWESVCVSILDPHWILEQYLGCQKS